MRFTQESTPVLTLEAKDEIIISSSGSQLRTAKLGVVVALFAHLFILHHLMLLSSYSGPLRGANHDTRRSIQETQQV